MNPNNEILKTKVLQKRADMLNHLREHTKEANFFNDATKKAEGGKINKHMSKGAKNNKGANFISKLVETSDTGVKYEVNKQEEVLKCTSNFYKKLYSTQRTDETAKIKV